MKSIKYIAITVVLLITGFRTEIQAQDLTLSQPFSSPLYIAPSFAGMTNGGRAFLTYRNQWASFSGGYNSALIGTDYFFLRQKFGLGGLLVYDRQAGGAITEIQFRPQYNYRVQLADKLFFRPAVELMLFYKAVDPSRLVFADQISGNGEILGGQDYSNIEQDNGFNVDVAVSGLLYNNDFWVGAAAHHITQADVSFLNEQTKTPMKISGFAGFRFVYNEDRYSNTEDAITLATIVEHQSPFTQLQIGAFWHRMPLELGLWYRGLPFSQSDLVNYDALVAVVGINFENFRVSYSYDVTISKLSSYTAGSHEIVLSYKFNQRNERDISFFCY